MQESRPVLSVFQTLRPVAGRYNKKSSRLSQHDPDNVYAMVRQIVVILLVLKKTLHVR